MTCGGCASAVVKAIRAADRDAEVEVDLPAAKIKVTGKLEPVAIQAAVERAGFQYRGVLAE